MIKKEKLIPLDVLTYIYILFKLIYISAGWNRIEQPLSLIISYLAIFIFAVLVQRLYKEGSNAVFKFIRYAYPMLFLGFFFNSATLVDRVIFSDYLDPFFQNIDYLMFGYQPAIEWGKRYSHIIIQELFHFAYFSYYIIIPLVAILILLKKSEYFAKFMFTFFMIFYTCYITYSILPVIGARYWEELFKLTMTYRGGPFTHIMAFIYSNSQHTGAAIPSSHVAMTLVANIGAYKYSKLSGTILFPLSLMLFISTVYCHYHYFIDVIFGIIYALILFKPAEMLYDLLEKKLYQVRQAKTGV